MTTSKLPLRIETTDPKAKVPTYGTPTSAAFDVCAVINDPRFPKDQTPLVVIPVGGYHTFGTGLKFEPPAGYYLQMHVRSSMGFKYGVRLRNSTGIVDPDYRDELMVCLKNEGTAPYEVYDGDRIAQVVLTPYSQADFVVVDEVNKTDRTGGIGSTGRR